MEGLGAKWTEAALGPPGDAHDKSPALSIFQKKWRGLSSVPKD